MNDTSTRVALVSLYAPEDGDALPLGAGCVAAALIRSARVRREDISLVNACVEAGDDLLFRMIVESKPRVVGFSLYCWNSSVSIRLAERLKDEFPDILVVAGGPDAERFYAERFYTERFVDRGAGHAALFDAIFLGEAEVSFPKWFAEAAGAHPEDRGNAAKFIRGQPCDAAALPSPWLEGLLEPVRGGSVAWELTRGCPYRCTYCYEGRGSSRLRHFPRERLEKELDLFVESGVKEVFVLDPTFNVQGGRTLSFLKLFSERGAGISWNFEIRAELLDRVQAEAFAAMPCSLQIGLQSVRPEVLKTIGRDMGKKEFAFKTRLLNQAGAFFGFDLIYGLPGDSLPGFRESLDFAISLYPNHLDIFPLAVLPGTPLHERSREYALDFDEEPPYLLRGHPSFPAEDMRAAARLARACDIFYTKGRAVPWFLPVLKPARMSPSAFLEGFDAPEAQVPPPHKELEALQCAYIERIYEARGMAGLLPAALDLVRYHGAWTRAFAEGETTRLDLSYPLHKVEGPEILDLAGFHRRNAVRTCRIEIGASDRGPVARII